MSWSPLWAAMTSLRAKYIRDLAIRGRATRTQQSYTSHVADLARHYRRAPDQISKFLTRRSSTGGAGKSTRRACAGGCAGDESHCLRGVMIASRHAGGDRGERAVL